MDLMAGMEEIYLKQLHQQAHIKNFPYTHHLNEHLADSILTYSEKNIRSSGDQNQIQMLIQ